MVVGDAGHDLAGGERGVVVVGFDCGGDAEVFVGDGPVGDAGVGEGHLHRAVAGQCCDCFETEPDPESWTRGDARFGSPWRGATCQRTRLG